MTIFIISAVVAVAVIFALMKFGKIEDKNGNNIPDVVDEKVKKAKEVAKEVTTEIKSRLEEVKLEASDVVEAVKEVAKQSADVVQAANGNKRKGRKPKSKK
jgi:F0F1-type ATP synthase membrane subunit b/b'